eukprot:gnl/Hemi2/2849_TR1019_c0_g1_i1.p1 gnl/Hemi2/2849_TR1019_c0_g1~~gnl/Hemi2/2849_TR1019_c0_g1_i1.p1  ORF type:complete len:260 (-),score=44.81 gnl/Hemi2/2849_TR1019_c0_g1_i1:96-875(-)
MPLLRSLKIGSVSVQGIPVDNANTLNYFELDRAPFLVCGIEPPPPPKAAFVAKGVMPAQVVDTNGVISRFTPGAPRHRAVPSSGLCAEGICSTETCAAKGQRVVINLGLGRFDFVLDRTPQKCRCPDCHQYVEPLCVAFVNCEWKFAGLRAGAAGQQSQAASSDWSRVDRGTYHTLPADDSSWVRLMYYTRPLSLLPQQPVSETDAKCSICQTAFLDGLPHQDLPPCGHRFHVACLDQWFAGGDRSCPCCPPPPQAAPS